MTPVRFNFPKEQIGVRKRVGRQAIAACLFYKSATQSRQPP